MGQRGPVPKRSESRQRRNVTDEQITHADGAEHVTIPRADSSWDPIARRLWDSLKASGQSKFYEPSDWAYAYSLMDDLSYYKQSSKRSGQMLASIYSAMERLLITEGDRRRVQIELSRPSADDQESSAGAQEAAGWYGKLAAVN